MARHTGAVTRQGRAWKLSVVQSKGDATWMNDIRSMKARPDGEPRTLHAMPPNASTGRKVKILKSGVKRVTYK